MSLVNCNYRCNCTIGAIIVSAIIGVLAAFLQITAVITVTPVFLWVAFGIAIAYLGVLVVTSALAERTDSCRCMCASLNAILIGALGSVLFAAVLLAVGIVATSVVSAILIGLLLFAFALMITASACLVRCLFGCGE